jgi:hypothetical protein
MDDRMYYERSGGRLLAWVYTEDGKYYFRRLYLLSEIIAYAKKHGYKLIEVI